MSTLAVVEEILRETGTPMSVREIVERAGDRLPTKSKTPDTVVARDLSMDIKKKGEVSIFTRTAPGRYTMREYVEQPREERVPEHAEVGQEAVGQQASDATAMSAAARGERQPPMAARKPGKPGEEAETVPAHGR
jgi:hypothetical protein